ncbi:MAG: YiiX/YebB-like N1pC/P60 family cysteine hydrolase [Kofleriaceae bacterium]
MTRSCFAIALAAAALATSTACNHSMVVSRPADHKLDDAYTTMWVKDLRANAQDGDLVLRRGYAVLSDVIVTVTGGPAMSHAAIYDGETGTLIDAVSSGVREVPADRFINASHHWMIIRPANRSAAERRAAVLRARGAIGTGFDFTGFVGLDDPDRFYCSELVAWALDVRDDVFLEDVLVAPGELTAVGPVVFDSGERGGRPTAQVDPYWQ